VKEDTEHDLEMEWLISERMRNAQREIDQFEKARSSGSRENPQDEATWAPMKPLVCELSARRIAQVWFNHANDLGKSFGDKTREWEMDTVAKLSKVEGDETAIKLEFNKARLRTPKTAGQFAPLIFRPSEDWKFEIAKGGGGSKSRGDVSDIMAEFGLRLPCRRCAAVPRPRRQVNRFERFACRNP
jgi:hypothetical protein